MCEELQQPLALHKYRAVDNVGHGNVRLVYAREGLDPFWTAVYRGAFGEIELLDHGV